MSLRNRRSDRRKKKLFVNLLPCCGGDALQLVVYDQGERQGPHRLRNVWYLCRQVVRLELEFCTAKSFELFVCVCKEKKSFRLYYFVFVASLRKKVYDDTLERAGNSSTSFVFKWLAKCL